MRNKISIRPGMYFVLPAALLILPVRWVFGWVLAVSVHELGHYLALRLCRIPIDHIEISLSGARMATSELQGREAVLCALAGPIFGLSLTLLSRFLPCTAFCGWLQAVFNLLPIYPLDGGRALRALLSRLCPKEATVNTIEWGIVTLVSAACLYLGHRYRLGPIPWGIAAWIFVQKFLANTQDSRYNRGEKLS